MFIQRVPVSLAADVLLLTLFFSKLIVEYFRHRFFSPYQLFSFYLLS